MYATIDMLYHPAIAPRVKADFERGYVPTMIHRTDPGQPISDQDYAWLAAKFYEAVVNAYLARRSGLKDVRA